MLERLPAHESTQIVEAALPKGAHSAQLAQQLVEKAEGNPFFLEELRRVVLEQHLEDPVLSVPATIEAVILARLDRLSPTAKHLLQYAAVIGTDVSIPLLQVVAGLSDTDLAQALHQLQHAEFLYELPTHTDPMYTFQHALTQEVAYHSLVLHVRQQYHARIAHLLTTRFANARTLSTPERLAYHYSVADCPMQALPYWHRAGEQAMQQSATPQAVAHFQQGLSLLKYLPMTPERIQHELTL